MYFDETWLATQTIKKRGYATGLIFLKLSSYIVSIHISISSIHGYILNILYDTGKVEEQYSWFKIGDPVMCVMKLDALKNFQEKHGGWNNEMAKVNIDLLTWQFTVNKPTQLTEINKCTPFISSLNSPKNYSDTMIEHVK